MSRYKECLIEALSSKQYDRAEDILKYSILEDGMNADILNVLGLVEYKLFNFKFSRYIFEFNLREYSNLDSLYYLKKYYLENNIYDKYYFVIDRLINNNHDKDILKDINSLIRYFGEEKNLMMLRIIYYYRNNKCIRTLLDIFRLEKGMYVNLSKQELHIIRFIKYKIYSFFFYLSIIIISTLVVLFLG